MNKKAGKRGLLRWILIGIAGALLASAFLVFGPNTGSHRHGDYFYVHSGWKYADVKQSLAERGFLRNGWSFDLLAKQVNYPESIHPGKYFIPKGSSNYYIVRMLRAGRQTPVQLVIKKIRTKQEAARLLAANLEPDSATWMRAMTDSALLYPLQLDTASALCLILPDTYESYWNWPAQKVLQKMADNYTAWWTADRVKAATDKASGQKKAMILASIVDEESNKGADRDTIAAVYLNRLKTGMKLQADPTARFAGGDFTIRRITSLQTNLNSPYNTYQVTGLPPGPICTPSRRSIEAVLGAPAVSYLYFCAKGDGSGTHLFATTYADHLKNAALYHQHLDQHQVH